MNDPDDTLSFPVPGCDRCARLSVDPGWGYIGPHMAMQHGVGDKGPWPYRINGMIHQIEDYLKEAIA